MREFLPKNGETRVVTKFLYTPLIIGNERRWGETTSWEEEFVDPYSDLKRARGRAEQGWWIKRRWVD